MGGEIVEVEGGHIVRSRGRKDRHSKVCTAKGPRDRRVRLSAHTAIEFYDVQDRLGYDRPSKALDWLIDKAKPAIDQLAQLPPWKPTLTNPNPQQQQQQNDDVVVAGNENPNPNHNHNQHQHGFIFHDDEEKQKQKENIDNHSGPGSGLGLGPGPGGFLPFDTEMVDTIRSYFPATTSSSAIQFQSYPQDLRLSLQSYENTSLNQNQHVQQHVLFTGTLDGMVPWNSGGGNLDTGNNDSASGGGFVFHAPSPAAVTLPMVMYGQNQYLSQRGPLQSSNTPSVRAWMDAPSFVAADYRQCLSMAAPSSSHSALGAGFAPGGFSGFRVPARIWGDDEEEHGDMPSSASSDSRR